MIKIDCYVCHQTLTEPGALLFSPPDENGVCVKHHFCVKCWTICFGPMFGAQIRES